MFTKKVANYLTLMRPYQWIKNLFIFAPLFFSFSFYFDAIFRVGLGFILFSLAASAIYVFNDIHDANEDRMHPIKRHRPIASGSVSKKEAYLLMFLLLSFSFLASLSLSHFLKS